MINASPGRDALLLEALAALSSDLQLRQVLQRIVSTACGLVDARYGALGVIGADGRLAEFIHEGLDTNEVAAIGPLPEGRGVLGLLIDKPEPLRLAELGAHPASFGFPAHHPPMRSFVGVPIHVRQQVFGNLYLCDKRGAPEFSAEDEELLVALAGAAGSAIANARLYDDVIRRERGLMALQGVATALLAGAATADVLRLVATHARDIIGADTAAVVGPGRDAEGIDVAIAVGDGAEALEGSTMSRAGTVLAEVLSTGRLVAVDNAVEDHRVPKEMTAALGAGPLLLAPLWLAGRPFGALAVAARRGRAPFLGEELRLVQSFATHASVALEHGRSEEERRHLAVLEERERIGRELHDSVISSLFATGLSLYGCQALTSDERLRSRLEVAVDDLDATIGRLRTTIFPVA